MGAIASASAALRPAATAAVLGCLLTAAAGGCSGGGGDRPSSTTLREPGARYVAPRLPARPQMWAVGDAAANTDAARRVAKLVRSARPDLLLYLGDVYETGTPAEFQSRYDPLYGSLAARTAPTPGNHDWPNAASGYFPYWRRELGHPLPPYYSFAAGRWRIISLNSELVGPAAGRQLRWLRRRFAGDGRCRLAFFHRPRFSGGLHGDDPALDGLWRALRGRITLVLNGHDHDLQELNPPGGPRILVSGAGGNGLYALHSEPYLAWGRDSVYGALRLQLRAGGASYAFVAFDGRVLRRGSVRCRG